MNTNWPRAYYLAESGEALAKTRQFRIAYGQWHKDIKERFAELNISGYRVSFAGKIYSVKFTKGNIPPEFKKVDKHGCTEPYKRNKEWINVMEGLPTQPQSGDYVAELINAPWRIKYKTKNGEGARRIDDPFSAYQVIFFSPDHTAPIAVVMGDVAGKIQDEQENLDSEILNTEILSWRMPNGFRRIFKEEWDLMAVKFANKKEDK